MIVGLLVLQLLYKVVLRDASVAELLHFGSGPVQQDLLVELTGLAQNFALVVLKLCVDDAFLCVQLVELAFNLPLLFRVVLQEALRVHVCLRVESWAILL